MVRKVLGDKFSPFSLSPLTLPVSVALFLKPLSPLASLDTVGRLGGLLLLLNRDQLRKGL